MKKFLLALTSISLFGLVALVAMPTYAEKPETPNNGNSHNKATGNVTWTARGGDLPGLVTVFDAHDLEEGGTADKGEINTYRPSDYTGFEEGTIKINVVCAHVEENEAWFAGTAVEGTGGYSSSVGNAYLYWVKDVATPGSSGDLLGGMPYYGNLSKACFDVDNENWTGTGKVTDGNLVVHYSDPEETAPYGPVSLEEGETYRLSGNAVDNKWDLSGEFVAHPGYNWGGLAEGATWNYDFHIKESLDDESSVGSLHFSTGDINVIGHVKDFKNDYDYWSNPNIAAVGTAIYNDVKYNFMFLYSKRAVWFALKDAPYDEEWDTGTVWGSRDYQVHSKVPDYEFPMDDYKDIH